MLAQSSRYVDGVEKKKRDTRLVLSDDAAAVDLCHATRPQRLEEDVLLLSLATIEDFLRRRANHRQFSERFAELFLSGFTRVTSHLINEKDRGAMNDVSAF